jgi:cold shock protein
MTLEDTKITCVGCGQDFTYTAKHRQQHEKKGWVAPKRCSDCSKSKSREGQSSMGVVKWFDASKGYGFIAVGNGDDVFVHYHQILGHEQDYKSLVAGQTVEFNLVTGKGGKPAAANVRVVEG